MISSMPKGKLVKTFLPLFITLAGVSGSFAALDTPSTAKAHIPASDKEIVAQLKTLAQYEIDLSHLLTQTMEKLQSKSFEEQLVKMEQKSKGVIKELSDLIVNTYKDQAPAYSRDLKGLMMSGYEAVRGALTDHGVLEALHTNMKLVLKWFESALNDGKLPEDIQPKVRKICEDKGEQIKAIETEIATLKTTKTS